MLLRVLGEGSGFCRGLATAAARWRPRGRLCARWGRVARQGEAQHDGKGGGEFLGDAWKLRGAGGGAGRWLSTAGGRRTALAASKQAGEEDRDPNEISKISGAYLKNIDNY